MIRILLISFCCLHAHNLLAKNFSDWKKIFSKDTVKLGIPEVYTYKILKGVKFDPAVVKKDRNQILVNKKVDYLKFIKKWKGQNPSRLELARKKLRKNITILQKVEQQYAVEKEVIVSLWGVETSFGRITGKYDVIRSLATLAYDGRRRAFFEKQLKSAILMLYRGHTTRSYLKGSWAGATGQCQFMPSNHHLAQDFDGDGKKDIWNNKADIFASIANYLKNAGWKKGQSIGILALNTKNKKVHGSAFRSPKEYAMLGFKRLDGKNFLDDWWKKKQAASIPLRNSPVVLKGTNYKAIFNWNPSVLFVAFNILMVNALK
ncbi:MAG: lytic transglycosylase domain-containing protein [Oligoflexales bacterium]